MIGNSADLFTKLTIAQERADRLKADLAVFRVLPEYHALEAEASQLTRELGGLADANTLDRRWLADLRDSLKSESSPPSDALDAVYSEAGVLLPASVKRRLEDVRRFHESVIRNRRSYLESEIAAE